MDCPFHGISQCWIRYHLTLALAGGRCDPPDFFCNARQAMIMLKFCIAYGASFAQLLVKNFDWVMLGHEAMTSQEVQGQAIFVRNSTLLHI